MGSAAPRAVVLADSDSRWKWAATVTRRMAPDHAVDACFLRSETTPTARQISEVGIVPDTSRTVECAELVDDPLVAAADLVVLGTTGGTMLTALHSLGIAWRGRARRPVVVTGYVGVIYENLVDGLLLRAGSDIVLANSTHDTERFRDIYRGLGLDPRCVVETALPYLGGSPHDPEAAGRDRRFTVCFAVQPSVPAGRAARLDLLRKMARHARLHPDRDVVVKLRNRPGEAVTHVERHSYQALFQELPDPPPNLSLRYGEMGEVLAGTDLLVTVSSTAAMEAVQRSVPTAILTDYGVREAHGNHFFVGSGLLASWAQLDTGTLPRVDPGWAARHGIGVTRPYDAARRRLAELRAAPALPPLQPYYTPERGGDYLKLLIQRRGIGTDGRPLPPAGPRRALGRGLRRRAARLYRAGRGRLGHLLPR